MSLFFLNIMTSHFPGAVNYFFGQPATSSSEKKEVRSLDQLREEASRLDEEIKGLRDRIDKIDDDFNNSLAVRIISIFFDIKVSKSSDYQAMLEEVGYGIANPGINICYINSILQALRMSHSFMKFINGCYNHIQKEKQDLSSEVKSLIKIAELPSRERNDTWTIMIRAKEFYAKILQNTLLCRLDTLPENTKKYLTLYGYREKNKKIVLSYLEKPGTDISKLQIQPALQFLSLRLEQSCHLNKPVEVVKKELSEIFSYVKGPEHEHAIDQLIDIQQKAKEESFSQILQALTSANKNLLSRGQQQDFVRYPVIIQLKKLYDIIEGTVGKKAAVADKESIQAIRQLVRFGGFEAVRETSQEDAFSFLGYLLDTMQVGLFSFSSHARGNEKGHSFSLGLGESSESSTMQKVISEIDYHCFTTAEEAPSFLPIQLKRYDNIGRKNKKQIEPSLVLQVSAKEGPESVVKYRLTSIVVHEGEGPQLGHYFTFAPKVLNGKEVWVMYSDSMLNVYKCSHTCPPNIILENGYLFLYEKEAS